MITDTQATQARKIARQFDDIKKRGGHAAIDYKNGDLMLNTSQPTSDPLTWGNGQVPQTYTDEWVRLAEC